MKTASQIFDEEVRRFQAATGFSKENAVAACRTLHRSLLENGADGRSAASLFNSEVARLAAENQISWTQAWEDVSVTNRALFTEMNTSEAERKKARPPAHPALETSAPAKATACENDALHPKLPKHLLAIANLSEDASAGQWSEFLANADSRLKPSSAGEMFNGLVRLIQTENQRTYDQAWGDARRKYPGVYRAMCANSGSKAATFGRDNEFLVSKKSSSVPKGALEALGLAEGSPENQYRIWLEASKTPLSILIASRAIAESVQFRQMTKGLPFLDCWTWVQQQKPELFQNRESAKASMGLSGDGQGKSRA